MDAVALEIIATGITRRGGDVVREPGQLLVNGCLIIRANGGKIEVRLIPNDGEPRLSQPFMTLSAAQVDDLFPCIQWDQFGRM